MKGQQGYDPIQTPEPRQVSILERVAVLEAEIKHLATKAWVLAGVVGGIAIAVGMVLTFIRLFGSFAPSQ